MKRSSLHIASSLNTCIYLIFIDYIHHVCFIAYLFFATTLHELGNNLRNLTCLICRGQFIITYGDWLIMRQEWIIIEQVETKNKINDTGVVILLPFPIDVICIIDIYLH